MGISYTTEYFSIRCDLNIGERGFAYAIGLPKITCLTYYLYEKTFLQDLQKWVKYMHYGEIEDYESSTNELGVNRGILMRSDDDYTVIRAVNTICGCLTECY